MSKIDIAIKYYVTTSFNLILSQPDKYNMEITDEGLQNILSLGLFKESLQKGIYNLYQWEEVKYYCGPESLKDSFNQNGLYISLSPKQIKLLPHNKKKTAKLKSQFQTILKYYETVLYVEKSEQQKQFTVLNCIGVHEEFEHLQLKSSFNSPFRIVEQTKKEYHGFCEPIGDFKNTLNEHNILMEKFWITAVPILDDNQVVKGIYVGISENQEYGIDSLDLFKPQNLKNNTNIIEAA